MVFNLKDEKDFRAYQERMEIEMKKDCSFYYKSNKTFNNFFYYLTIDANNTYYSDDKASAEDKTFAILKKKSIKEVWHHMLYRDMPDEVSIKEDTARYAAYMLIRSQRCERYIQIDKNAARVRQSGKIEGHHAEEMAYAVYEAKNWVHQWVRDDNIDKLIELGEALEQMRAKINGNTNIGRRYFCYMYWNYCRKLFQRSGEQIPFQEFMFYKLKALGLEMPNTKTIPRNKQGEPNGEPILDDNPESFGAYYRSKLKLSDNSDSPIITCTEWQ